MCLLIVVSICTIMLRSRKKILSTEEDPTILFLRRHRSASVLPPVFTYDELESSTNHFDPKRKIGDSGFESVYLGQLYNDRIVAVRKRDIRKARVSSLIFGTTPEQQQIEPTRPS